MNQMREEIDGGEGAIAYLVAVVIIIIIIIIIIIVYLIVSYLN
jgi:hypothetical protein